MSDDREIESRVRSAIARVVAPPRATPVARPRRMIAASVAGAVAVLALLLGAVVLGDLVAAYRTSRVAATPTPAASTLPSAITRNQAISAVRALDALVGRVDRAEAKLLTLAEYLQTAGPIRSLPADPRATAMTGQSGTTGFVGDPSLRYVWAVAVSGEVWPQQHRPIRFGNPPFGSPPQTTAGVTPNPAYRWGIFLVDATSGKVLVVADAGISEAWPPVFDLLASHAAGTYAASTIPLLSPIAVGEFGMEAMTDVLRSLGPNARLDRVEYKLMTWEEFTRSAGARSATTLPVGAPVWIVAIAGDFGGTRLPSPDGSRAHSAVFVVDPSASNCTKSVVAVLTDAGAEWPAFFDALPDHPPAMSRP